MLFKRNKKAADNIFVSLYAYKPVFSGWLSKHRIIADQADDIFQEALLIFYKKTHQPDFVESSKPETFLMGICKYLAYNRIRTHRNFTNIETSEVIQIESEIDDIQYLVEKEQKINQINLTLENVGERCYKLLTGFYFEKKSLDELCTDLDISGVNVIKVQKHRCLEKVKNMIKTTTNQYAKR